jgi:RimJ/RimL family protein N-acetyltransferase
MIEGELVNLRAREMSDLGRVTGWVNDPEVVRFFGPRYPRARAVAEARLQREISAPMTFSDAWFAIETKDGRHIGNCGLDGTVEDRKAVLGIAIGEKDCWSRGYGTDAVRTLILFGFDEMNLNKVALSTLAFNERAQACYRKCGFIEEGRLRQAHYSGGAFHDEVHMSVLRDEFYARERAAEQEATR